MIKLKPLLASAIQAELRMLELGLARIAERLQAFEKQYSLTSEEFAHRFATGEIGESLDYIEWAGEMETLGKAPHPSPLPLGEGTRTHQSQQIWPTALLYAKWFF